MTPTPEMLAMAREIAADTQDIAALRKYYLDGTRDNEIHVRIALAAITAVTERAAALADRYHAACVPNVTIGDDDSIYLTEHEEGQKRAAYVIREKLRANDHLKDPTP